MESRGRRGRSERESKWRSPDRAKVRMMQMQMQQQTPKVEVVVKPTHTNTNNNIKKVQVVYYLSRNGQLEHPHYIEVSHFPNHPLRLRDFVDRLTILRGKGMPSLYSWSCKRSYKNGYVWNDLAENDIIYPSDGAEFVLKGSELVEGCSERLQQLNLSGGSNRAQVIQEPPSLHHIKRKQLAPSQPGQLDETHHSTNYGYQEFEPEQQHDDDEEEEDDESQEEFEEDEEKTSYTTSTTPHSRCSRGVSTEELDDPPPKKPAVTATQPTLHDPPPPLQPSAHNDSNNTSKRFEDGDPVGVGSAPSRNSVLFQLISCGNLVTRGKNVNNISNDLKPPIDTRVSYNNKNNNNHISNVIRRSGSDLQRGVVYKTALKVVSEEEGMMLRCMSENPRFGNLQAEEKEYFSGSIVESMSDNHHQVVGLKRSNSYNEERRSKSGVEEVAVKEVLYRERALKGKCIPRKKSSKQIKK